MQNAKSGGVTSTSGEFALTEDKDNWLASLEARRTPEAMADELAKTPLETLEDCYEFLEAGWPPPCPPPTFAEVQRAYRSKLWRYNPNKPGLVEEAAVFRTLMIAKIKAAYAFVCAQLGKDPDEGLEETEAGLIVERDRLLEGWKDWWCGTPSMMITHEYEERIEALKRDKETMDDRNLSPAPNSDDPLA